jgi:hypothetical protein
MEDRVRDYREYIKAHKMSASPEEVVASFISDQRQLIINGVRALVQPVDWLTTTAIVHHSVLGVVADMRQKVGQEIDQTKDSGRIEKGRYFVDIDWCLYAQLRVCMDVEGVLRDAVRARGLAVVPAVGGREPTAADDDVATNRAAVEESIDDYGSWLAARQAAGGGTSGAQPQPRAGGAVDDGLSDEQREMMSLAAQFKGTQLSCTPCSLFIVSSFVMSITPFFSTNPILPLPPLSLTLPTLHLLYLVAFVAPQTCKWRSPARRTSSSVWCPRRRPWHAAAPRSRSC